MEKSPAVNQLQPNSPEQSLSSSPSSSPPPSSGVSPEITTRTGNEPSGSGKTIAKSYQGSSAQSAPSGVVKETVFISSQTGQQQGRPPKANIKREPQDEIKDYAETTMNELLGWYGYNDVVHKEDTVNLNLKQFAANGGKIPHPDGVLRRPPGVSVNMAVSDIQKSAEEVNSKSDQVSAQHASEGVSNSIASKNQTIVAALTVLGQSDPGQSASGLVKPGQSLLGPQRVKEEQIPDTSGQDVSDCAELGVMSPRPPSTSSDLNNAESSPDAATCGIPATPTCLWCQKVTGDKPFALKTDDGGEKVFCTDLCFTMCRRASFKKSKVCDWCKKVKNTVSYVDFQDGEQQLQFCSDQCLNQYKMNIFCKETQSIKSQLGAAVTAPASSVSKQIIITPDLWTERQRLDREAQLVLADRTSRAARGTATGLTDSDRNSRATRGTATGPTDSDLSSGRHRDDKDGPERFDHQQVSKTKSGHYSHGGERKSNDLHGNMASNKHASSRFRHATVTDADGFSKQRMLISGLGQDSVKHNEKRIKSPKREPLLYSPLYSRPASKTSDTHSVATGNKTKPNSDRARLSESGDSLSYAALPRSVATSPGSDLSSTPRSSIHQASGGLATSLTSPGGLATSLTSPGGLPTSLTSPVLPASQLLSSLGPGLQQWMMNPVLASGISGLPGVGPPGFGLPAYGPSHRLPGSSLNMASPPPDNHGNQETRAGAGQAASTHPLLGAAVPGQTTHPLLGAAVPPRPPFPLHPGHSGLLGMFPPPGIPSLLPLAGAMPPLGNMGGLLPPSTLMVPYPVIIPIPIPLPLPIPIPIPCDKDGNPMLPSAAPPTTSDLPVFPVTQIKQERPDTDLEMQPNTDLDSRPDLDTEPIRSSTSYEGAAEENIHMCSSGGVKQIACACCQTKPANEEPRKTHLSPPRAHHSPSHYSPAGATLSTSSGLRDIQNDAIDLSKDRLSQSKSSSGSAASVDLNRNNTLLLRASPPSSSESENSATGHQLPLGGIGVPRPVDSVYSSRRSLILDAPRTHSDRGRHSPEKRHFVGGLSKEHTYGKRRCVRARIRTK